MQEEWCHLYVHVYSYVGMYMYMCISCFLEFSLSPCTLHLPCIPLYVPSHANAYVVSFSLSKATPTATSDKATPMADSDKGGDEDVSEASAASSEPASLVAPHVDPALTTRDGSFSRAKAKATE